MATQRSGFVKTLDGVRLAYSQSGPTDGQSLLFIPGWRQTAATWRKQVEHFASRGFNVTTYDHRGHGQSDKPHHGHRIYRYAADLKDLITSAELSLSADKQDRRHLTLVGHSMGVGIILVLWDLYPELHPLISHLVLIDQNPAMIDGLGGRLPPDRPIAMTRDVRSMTTTFTRHMFTPSAPPADVDFFVSQALLFADDADAGQLFLSHCFSDWRHVLGRVDVPALVVAAEASTQDVEAVRKTADGISGSEFVVFGADEGGSHFMFWENPDKFNRVVEEFLSKKR